MAEFEVIIASPEAKSVSITLSVGADGWLDAWHQGLRIMGDGAPPPDTTCVLTDDHAVEIRAPGAARTFIIRQINPDGPTIPRGPRLERGAPRQVSELVAEANVVPDAPAPPSPDRGAAPRARTSAATRDRATRPDERPTKPDIEAADPSAETSASTEDTTPTLAPPRFDDAVANIPAVVDGQPSQNQARRDAGLRQRHDPVIRALDALERARRHSRPVRISPDTGLPQRVPLPTPQARGRVEQTLLGVPAPTTGRRRRPRPTHQGTAAFTAAHSGGPLPQQFHAIDPRGDGPKTPEDVLLQAIDTAWQHIPCRLAQALRWRSSTSLDVVAARGERAREFESCRVHAAQSFSQLSGGHPARIKFSGDPARVRYQTPDGGVYDETVRSALCVPLAIGEEDFAVLVLLDARREGPGFADSELRALSYLGETVTRTLTPMLQGWG